MGMKLQYNLENIGNIDKASITIKPLTIIAGENSSGKTFVTKSLYTILLYVQNTVLKEELFHLHSIILRETSEELFQEIRNTFVNEEEIYNLFDEFNQVFFSHKILKPSTETILEYRKVINGLFKNSIPLSIKKLLNNVSDIVNEEGSFFFKEIAKKLDISLKKNFQITNLKSLIKDSNNKSINLSIKNICEVVINNELKFLLNKNNQIKNIDNVVFFDSPIYIKIRKALEKKPLSRWYNDIYQDEDKYLKGYPEYIDDLYHDLDLEYIDTADFDEISQEIQKIISGKLDVSRSGDINYTDNQNNTIPLSLTAMGISNIGLIDLLLRNNVINKGSFLIMDEPEVHLHPEWQVILAQLLYKIAKGGANIIIATHSLDFLKAFENILKEENEVAEEIIAINKMPYTEEFSEKTELEKVGIVLDDLSRPFYNLYMKNI